MPKKKEIYKIRPNKDFVNLNLKCYNYKDVVRDALPFLLCIAQQQKINVAIYRGHLVTNSFYDFEKIIDIFVKSIKYN